MERLKLKYKDTKKALDTLKEIFREPFSVIVRDATIQRFEYTFELGWKTLKDFFESKNVEVKFTRDVIKESFKTELLDDGEIWLEMLEKRNLMAHTYDEVILKSVLNDIESRYFDQLKKIYVLFKSQV